MTNNGTNNDVFTNPKQILDICPNAPDGKHRYFIYRVITEYEQVPPMVRFSMKDPTLPEAVESVELYKKVEYALSGCNCGHPLKRKVEEGENV